MTHSFKQDLLTRTTRAWNRTAKPRGITFADIPIGTEFEFAGDTRFSTSGLMRGPWIKTSIRLYVLRESPDFRCRVGTVNVEVIPSL